MYTRTRCHVEKGNIERSGERQSTQKYYVCINEMSVGNEVCGLSKNWKGTLLAPQHLWCFDLGSSSSFSPHGLSVFFVFIRPLLKQPYNTRAIRNPWKGTWSFTDEIENRIKHINSTTSWWFFFIISCYFGKQPFSSSPVDLPRPVSSSCFWTWPLFPIEDPLFSRYWFVEKLLHRFCSCSLSSSTYVCVSLCYATNWQKSV